MCNFKYTQINVYNLYGCFSGKLRLQQVLIKEYTSYIHEVFKLMFGYYVIMLQFFLLKNIHGV